MSQPFLVGFYSRKAFILSQHPLDDTVPSLWQLVAEQSVQVVVVLTSLDNCDYRPFWPASTNGQMTWDTGFPQYTVDLSSQDQFSCTSRLRLQVRYLLLLQIPYLPSFAREMVS